jgi:hypothetical protein
VVESQKNDAKDQNAEYFDFYSDALPWQERLR